MISKLQLMRVCRKMSQVELSEKSGVNIKTIQSYEQFNRDINHANISTVRALAKALDCSMEELLN